MTVIDDALLFIDLGNSSTEVTIAMPKSDGSGDYVKLSTELPNRFAKTSQTAQFVDPVNTDNSWRFNLNGTHRNMSDYDKGSYDGGLIVSREYSNVLRPTAIDNKYTSTPALLALNSAFLFGFKLVSKATGVPLEDIEIVWSKVVVLIPPAKMGLPNNPESGLVQMTQVIRSIEEIDFTFPSVQKKINLKENAVIIASEGHAGFLSVLYNPDGKSLRPGYEYLKTSNTMIIDIGAGTTDFVQIVDSKPIESSKYTIASGGNNVAQTLGKLLVEAGLPEKKDAILQKAVLKGTIKDGGQEVDIREQLREAKEQVAAHLINSLVEYLERTNISVTDIENLLVIGGGSSRVINDAGEEVVEPLSEMLVRRIRNFSPNTKLVPLPKEITNGVAAEVSPRKLNIKGAVILGCALDRASRTTK